MSSPDLKKYEYGRKFSDLVGTVLLADSTTQVFDVSDTTSQVVLGPFDGTGLVDYGYQTDYPLMLKVFCYDITPDSTGDFKIKINGSLGGGTSIRRRDDSDFGLTWQIRDWDKLVGVDATVTAQVFPPMTSVSMKCVCGLATDYIDRASEGSYA